MWLAAKIVIIAAVCSGVPINDVPCQVTVNLRGEYDLRADGQGGMDGLPRRIVIGPDAVTAALGYGAEGGFRGKLSCDEGRRNRAARDTAVPRMNVEDKERAANGSVHGPRRNLTAIRPSDFHDIPLRDTTHMAFEVALSKPANLSNVTVEEVVGHVCMHLFWRPPASMSYWFMNMTDGQPCDTDQELEDYVADHYPIAKSDRPSSRTVRPVTAVPPVQHELPTIAKILNRMIINAVMPFGI